MIFSDIGANSYLVTLPKVCELIEVHFPNTSSKHWPCQLTLWWFGKCLKLFGGHKLVRNNESGSFWLGKGVVLRRRGVGLGLVLFIDSKAPAGSLPLIEGLLRLVLIGFGLHLLAILDGELLETADDLLTLLQVDLRFLIITLLGLSLAAFL